MSEQSEILAKAAKLLEALACPHENDPKIDDHQWRRCRACLAREELDAPGARQLLTAASIALVQTDAAIRAGQRDALRVGLHMLLRWFALNDWNLPTSLEDVAKGWIDCFYPLKKRETKGTDDGAAR